MLFSTNFLTYPGTFYVINIFGVWSSPSGVIAIMYLHTNWLLPSATLLAGGPGTSSLASLCLSPQLQGDFKKFMGKWSENVGLIWFKEILKSASGFFMIHVSRCIKYSSPGWTPEPHGFLGGLKEQLNTQGLEEPLAG